jgi:DNA-binding Lrp family transcriptional regulator
MRAALEENPPPSFSEVARRIGCTRENLRKKIPDLSADINRRYEDYLFVSRKENLAHLEWEVRKAFIKLQNENEIISMNKVKEMLPRKWNDKNFKNAYRMISEEMKLEKND